jgi:hypothetical protein
MLCKNVRTCTGSDLQAVYKKVKKRTKKLNKIAQKESAVLLLNTNLIQGQTTAYNIKKRIKHVF